MRRILIDSQNNPLFLGSALEQAYAYRGGLCQGGHGDIVVLPGLIEPAYLEYWRTVVKLPMPDILCAAQDEATPATTTQLLLRNSGVVERLLRMIGSEDTRLEFFCIGEDERELAQLLRLSTYADFDVAIRLARKSQFKKWWNEIGISTPEWALTHVGESPSDAALALIRKAPAVLKLDDGTGGLACGGTVIVTNAIELRKATAYFADDGRFANKALVLERLVPNAQTFSVHWRVESKHSFEFVGVFEQIGEFAYAGVRYPVKIPECLRTELEATARRMQRSIPESIGYFCGDVVIGADGKLFWVDFNPRKGAIAYVFDAVSRIAREWGWSSASPAFAHQHQKFAWLNGGGFAEIESRLHPLLVPDERGFVLVTNPGLFPFGYVDITGIASTPDAALRMLSQAQEQLR